jgi:CHAT domain-containing protein
MKKLYSQIRSGIAIEAAMRRSMASIRAKKEWESPYYWASFALFTR